MRVGYVYLYELYCNSTKTTPAPNSNYWGMWKIFFHFWIWNIAEFSYNLEEFDAVGKWSKENKDSIFRKK
jgi:hypothetical protein